MELHITDIEDALTAHNVEEGLPHTMFSSFNPLVADKGRKHLRDHDELSECEEIKIEDFGTRYINLDLKALDEGCNVQVNHSKIRVSQDIGRTIPTIIERLTPFKDTLLV